MDGKHIPNSIARELHSRHWQGRWKKKEIERSLNYLKTHVVSCRTPLSLGWALFGLGAWGERPTEAKTMDY